MALTLTDRRTILDEAEANTNWTPAGYGTTTLAAEAANAVAESFASTTGQVYYTMPTGSIDLSDTLVYVYSFNNALQDAWDASPPPNALLLGDGTDRIAFDMAGADRRVFNHLDGPTEWQCLVLDGDQADEMDTAGNSYVVSGSFAGLNLAAITDVGCSFDTNSKALGGGYNVAVDIIRYGNDGIRLTAGTTGDRGVFLEIAVADRSTANQAAHGILRELTTGVYGCQGPLTFGNSGAATTCYFEDSGIVLAFEDRNISNDKYYFNVEGNSGATNLFILTGATITTAGPHVGMTMNGGNVNTLTFDTVVFSNLGNRAILFSSSADASGHLVQSCVFDNCGKIDAGTIDFLGTSVINSAATDHAIESGGGDMTGLSIAGYEGTADTAALAWTTGDDTDGNLDNASFVMGTALTHAIEFEVSGGYTFNDLVFTGYHASDEQNDSALYNAITPTTVDSYSESNQDSDGNIGGGAVIQEFGQEFSASAGDLSSVRFYLKKTGSPTGTAVARLYASDGGSPAIPTGAALAESETLDVSTLTGSYVLTQLNFADEYTMAATDYFIALEYTGGDGSNYIQAGYDGSSPSHGGNSAARTTGGSWTGFSGQDACFYVYRDGHVIVSIASGSTPSTKTVNVGAHTTVQNTKTIEITGVTEGARVVIERSSDGVELLNELAFTSDGAGAYKATASFAYVSDTAVRVGAAASGKVVAGIADDTAAFTDETIQANDSRTGAGETMTLIPTTSPASPDGFYFGHTEQFLQMDLDVLTAGAGTYTVAWEYWNGGSWASLPGISDGSNNLKTAGRSRISWTTPGSWTARQITNQPGPSNLYYIRCRFVSGTVTTTPVGRTAHLDVTRYRRWEDEATIVSTGLSAKATWIEDSIAIF